ncbi:hypothetical protein Pcinc_005291 [Petrolisthes cinctipes]|uniref:Mitochondrial import inner membrane translocase subunit n=1 Tax=Petrolisthes cinctipes TaxID=88211 RepID=A0AAE1GJR7_PETCI|nr:hypothetical protein Pcinc_005291 [Petrolisthes cinctipes]
MGWLWGDSDSSSSSSSSSSSGSDFDTSSFSSDTSSSFSSFDSGPSFSSTSGLDSGGSSGKDQELQSFLVMEQQKAQMQSMIHKMNDLCWETCVGTPGSRLDSRTETCISNCVERFIDSSLFITNRFAQLLSKSSGGMM